MSVDDFCDWNGIINMKPLEFIEFFIRNCWDESLEFAEEHIIKEEEVKIDGEVFPIQSELFIRFLEGETLEDINKDVEDGLSQSRNLT